MGPDLPEYTHVQSLATGDRLPVAGFATAGQNETSERAQGWQLLRYGWRSRLVGIFDVILFC